MKKIIVAAAIAVIIIFSFYVRASDISSGCFEWCDWKRGLCEQKCREDAVYKEGEDGYEDELNECYAECASEWVLCIFDCLED